MLLKKTIAFFIIIFLHKISARFFDVTKYI